VNGDPLDLRLAGLATATWLSALAALRTPLAVVVWSAVLATAGAAAVALATPRWRPGWWSRCRLGWLGRARFGGLRWTVVGVLLGVVCGAAATGARLAARDAGPVADLARAGARVNADLTVREDPRRLPGVTNGPPTYLIRAQLTRVRPTDEARSVRLSVRVVILTNNASWYGLLPGQRIEARARVDTPRGGGLTAAVLSASGAPRPVGEPAWFQRAAGSLRAGLQRACNPLPDEMGGLLPGLVVGDVSRLDPAVADNFRTTGMTHLTAVSGANVG
jgi:competence protein ComEC